MAIFAKISIKNQCSIDKIFSTFREEKLGFLVENLFRTGSAWRRVWTTSPIDHHREMDS